MYFRSPSVNKNSEGLFILNLEFDDVMVKTLYFAEIPVL